LPNNKATNKKISQQWVDNTLAGKFNNVMYRHGSGMVGNDKNLQIGMNPMHIRIPTLRNKNGGLENPITL
jgi:hypothetical protein